MGGRLRSQAFEGAGGVVAELGGMRFPVSSTPSTTTSTCWACRPGRSQPADRGRRSTVIDLEGVTHYARALEDLPPLFTEVAEAWAQALEDVRFSDIQDAIRARDVSTLKSLWNDLVPRWDDRTFYDFVASSKALSRCRFTIARSSAMSVRHWRLGLDYPNSMLEIFRVVMTNCDENQRLVAGGAEQVPRGIWRYPAPGSPTGLPVPRWPRCTPARPGPASRRSHATAMAGSRSPTTGVTPAGTRRC